MRILTALALCCLFGTVACATTQRSPGECKYEPELSDREALLIISLAKSEDPRLLDRALQFAEEKVSDWCSHSDDVMEEIFAAVENEPRMAPHLVSFFEEADRRDLSRTFLLALLLTAQTNCDSTCFEHIRPYLNSRTESHRAGAALALGTLGDDSALERMHDLVDEMSRPAPKALVVLGIRRMCHPASAELMEGLKNDGQLEIRTLVREWLDECADAQ